MPPIGDDISSSDRDGCLIWYWCESDDRGAADVGCPSPRPDMPGLWNVFMDARVRRLGDGERVSSASGENSLASEVGEPTRPPRGVLTMPGRLLRGAATANWTDRSVKRIEKMIRRQQSREKNHNAQGLGRGRWFFGRMPGPLANCVRTTRSSVA